MPRPIEFEDIKTKADANKFYQEHCIASGLKWSIGSYVVGVATFPVAVQKFGKKIPFMQEYKMLIGAMGMMFVSYGIGIYMKDKCEEKLKKQLHELALEN